MRPSWDYILNIGLVFSFLAISYTWPVIVLILIVIFIIFQIIHIQWEHDLILKGNISVNYNEI